MGWQQGRYWRGEVYGDASSGDSGPPAVALRDRPGFAPGRMVRAPTRRAPVMANPKAWVMALSIMLLVLAVFVIAYGQWGERRYRAERPPAPAEERLPERLPTPAPSSPAPRP